MMRISHQTLSVSKNLYQMACAFFIIRKILIIKKTLEKFNEKIKKCSTNKPLFCIGYNLPPSKIQKNFSKPVYFTKSTFSDPDFSECNFQYADFSGSKLQNEFSQIIFSFSNFRNAVE